MATRYLLPCACGREIAVEAGQAGDRVRCECGSTVAVPKLGELRLRPRIEAAEAKSTWSARHGILTVGILVALVSLGVGIYFWTTTPARDDYDMQAEVTELADIQGRFEMLSPLQTWMYWHQVTVPLARHGLQERVTPQSVAFDQHVDERKTYQKLAFGAAGFAVLFCVVVALWRPR